jgi:hypothetical protein
MGSEVCIVYINYIIPIKSEEDEVEVIEAVRAVGSNMVLRGCFLYGIRICRFTASQVKAKYH